MKHTDIKQILTKPEEYFGKSVTVCGWIRSFRDSKNMAFIALNDGTTLSHLQIVIENPPPVRRPVSSPNLRQYQIYDNICLQTPPFVLYFL